MVGWRDPARSRRRSHTGHLRLTPPSGGRGGRARAVVPRGGGTGPPLGRRPHARHPRASLHALPGTPKGTFVRRDEQRAFTTPGWVPSQASRRVPPADFRVLSHPPRGARRHASARWTSACAGPGKGRHLLTRHKLAHSRGPGARHTGHPCRVTLHCRSSRVSESAPTRRIARLTGRGTSLGASPAGSWPGARHHSACSAFHGGTPSMRVAHRLRARMGLTPRPRFSCPGRPP